MVRHGRRWFLSTLCSGALACAGCSLNSLYFLMPESLEPPEIHALANPDKKKVNRVAILTYMHLETQAACLQADRQLSELLTKCLQTECEAHDQKLTLVPPRKVEVWKSAHPDWQPEDLPRIARALKVDYLIYLEINTLSFRETNHYNQLYRGRISGTVALVDPDKPDDMDQRDFSYAYPSDARPVPVDADTSEAQFRQNFLGYVAKKLSRCFVPHHKREDWYVEYGGGSGLGP